MIAFHAGQVILVADVVGRLSTNRHLLNTLIVHLPQLDAKLKMAPAVNIAAYQVFKSFWWAGVGFENVVALVVVARVPSLADRVVELGS